MDDIITIEEGTVICVFRHLGRTHALGFRLPTDTNDDPKECVAKLFRALMHSAEVSLRNEGLIK